MSSSEIQKMVSQQSGRTSCPTCGLTYQCICAHAPQIQSDIQIALLTHPKELDRPTNTGKLLLQTLPNCQLHVWDRVNPPAELLDQISQQPTYLLFPSDDALPIQTTINQNETALFIVLDGTWQEAKKMLNKSPWLKTLPKVMLAEQNASNYSLRRNQESGNLCTCEVGIELLQQLDNQTDIKPLQSYFELFLEVFEDDRNHRVHPQAVKCLKD
ncbi:MAG: tRNA-uridine aminocarboxypropyltransferase [Vibrio sp.]